MFRYDGGDTLKVLIESVCKPETWDRCCSCTKSELLQDCRLVDMNACMNERVKPSLRSLSFVVVGLCIKVTSKVIISSASACSVVARPCYIALAEATRCCPSGLQIVREGTGIRDAETKREFCTWT